MVKNYLWGPFHAYKISKAAMNMLNQQFAGELEAEGFCVALITPGVRFCSFHILPFVFSRTFRELLPMTRCQY
jgi:NAD(P)-dependent dehydrogenase (short-subunit alcohol dehydrogenase family)